MYTFGIILGVIITIAIVVAIASGFKEKFSRNFIFTGTAASILLGEAFIFIGLFILSDEGVTIDGSVGALVVDLITFSVNVTPDMDPAMIDFGSGVIAFGSLLFLLAWGINIQKSSFIWGMTQNILQTIIVAAFSVIIVIGALFLLDKKNRNGEN